MVSARYLSIDVGLMTEKKKTERYDKKYRRNLDERRKPDAQQRL